VTVGLLAVLGEGVVDPAQPVLRADDLGLTRGDGCFEGLRVVASADGASADKLDAHLARMARSAASLGIPFDETGWRELVEQACAAWDEPGEAAMKLLLTRGVPGSGRPTGLLTISALPEEYVRQRRDGLRVVSLTRGTTSDAYREAPWLLGGVKTLSYAVNMAAVRTAAAQGADDIIFVAADGQVLESAVSSVVWSSGRVLRTTPTGPSGILASTTQALLFERAAAAGWRTETSPATMSDLHGADVVWLVGSVRGPVDVVELDGKQRPRDPETDAEIRALVRFPPA
jgi:4-amino-4-deoxychorismate lyase